MLHGALFTNGGLEIIPIIRVHSCHGHYNRIRAYSWTILQRLAHELTRMVPLLFRSFIFRILSVRSRRIEYTHRKPPCDNCASCFSSRFSPSLKLLRQKTPQKSRTPHGTLLPSTDRQRTSALPPTKEPGWPSMSVPTERRSRSPATGTASTIFGI